MSEKPESDEFEEEDAEDTAAGDDVDVDHIMRDVESQRRRAPKGAEPAWRRLERVMEERRTAELLSDFDDYEIGDSGENDEDPDEKTARKKKKPRCPPQASGVPLEAPGREIFVITVFTEEHLLRNAKTELHGGRLVPPHECPERAEIVLERVRAVGLGDVVAPSRFGLAPVLKVHDPAFVDFLKSAWAEWTAAGNQGEAIPDCWPARRMVQRCPDGIAGKLGYYAVACQTSISAGPWEAARPAADVSVTASSHIEKGARSSFALCRPPGHHAARDLYGGY